MNPALIRCITLLASCMAASAYAGFEVQRFESNPLITFADSPSLAECAPIYKPDYPDCPSINGPSVIRVPDWIERPLGRYYMYFANHVGGYIRLAFANSPEGPWSVYEPGVLGLDEIGEPFFDHIASPDVHIDEENQRVLMYFHAPVRNLKAQKTAAAMSSDGLKFNLATGVLGRSYFRVFKWRGRYYAVAKLDNEGSGELYEADQALGPFLSLGPFISRMRHAAVLRCESKLYVFYTRVGDSPERILVTRVDLNKPAREWSPDPPREVLAPQLDYEGAQEPVTQSVYGGSYEPEKALRDPYVFRDKDRLYLYYSIAGEQGIAGATLAPPVGSRCFSEGRG